jgi:GT2 family glycosyltransferase
MPSAEFDISIVILTWNRRENLQELLDGLVSLRPLVCDIIVVDNHSEDGTAEMVRAEYPAYQCIQTEKNEGVSARNHGISAASGAVVITLDDDLLGLSRADLVRLENEFANSKKLGALNFQVVDFFTKRTCNWVHHRPPSHCGDRFYTYEITEGAVAVRREAFEKTGGYCQDFFISHEGPDLAYRLMNLGYTVEFDGRICLEHKHADAGRQSWRFYYFDTRNTIWLAVRNMPWMKMPAYLVRSLGAMAVYAIRDGFFVWWLRAVWDAMVGLPKMLATRQPWTAQTGEWCKEADRHRPGFWTLVRQRLSGGNARMDT